MRILVTGADGFIGALVVNALNKSGHEVLSGVRRRRGNRRYSDNAYVYCDYSTDTSVDVWLPRLSGVDAVVNCVGILRETKRQSFRAIHTEAPCSLFEACLRSGVKKIVQISALGAPVNNAFVRTKHDADECLAKLDLDWVVLRPSVVYTLGGSYGGTSLIRAIASIPFLIVVPKDPKPVIQPIVGEDLAEAVVRAVESKAPLQRTLEVVGPEQLTFEDFLLAFRKWLRFPDPIVVRVPWSVVGVIARMGEFCASGPLGMTMYKMLKEGNVGKSDAVNIFCKTFGFVPRSITAVLGSTPSYVQDRWHARIYFLRPILWFSIAILWILSGLVGLVHHSGESELLLTQAGVPGKAITPVIYGASIVDLTLGTLLLSRRLIHVIGFLMLLSLLIYTLFIGVFLPTVWLEPFGGLLKNIPLFPAILIMMAIEDNR